MKKLSIDLGYDEKSPLPLSGRKSIAVLLGAGFSVPQGYPTGAQMNKWLLDFDDKAVGFSHEGRLAVSKDGEKPKFMINGIPNSYEKYFIFCKRLIKEYSEAHDGDFDYELFYDFINSAEAKEERYQSLCRELFKESETYDSCLYNVKSIYNQMVEYLLVDKNGKNHYDDEPFKIGYIEGYDGFLKYLSKVSDSHIVNVHTLNHDLLFESFNKTEHINGMISDGFDEYGSEYYGILNQENIEYHCRLERYTGRYNSPIRLFKLHGSLDYVPFIKTTKDCIMIPERYVKTKWGIGPSDLIKGEKSKIGYARSFHEYHPDFLTGTTAKIQRYNEPLLFRKLFKHFRKNLRNAEKLIIIGYGCKDNGINEKIMKHFDYINKPVFIVDKCVPDEVQAFGDNVHAKIYKADISEINENLFS